MRKVLILCSDNILDPASRLRGYFVGKNLKKLGFNVKIYLYERKKGINLLKETIDKFKDIIWTGENGIIFIQRGVGFRPWLSAVFLTLSKILKKKVVYDFDDPLFMQHPFVTRYLIKYSDLVIVGSHALSAYTKQLNRNVALIPTSANLKLYKIKEYKKANTPLRLGFISSQSSAVYINLIIKPLEILAKKYDYELLIVSAKTWNEYKKLEKIFNKLKEKDIKIKLLLWSIKKEYDFLQKIDIGLAPLARGTEELFKCGFRVINYMAAGVPPVASAYGEHLFIIKDGYNGYLCKNTEDWVQKLKTLIENPELRWKMGLNARKTVEEKFSLEKNTVYLAKLLMTL